MSSICPYFTQELEGSEWAGHHGATRFWSLPSAGGMELGRGLGRGIRASHTGRLRDPCLPEFSRNSTWRQNSLLQGSPASHPLRHHQKCTQQDRYPFASHQLPGVALETPQHVFQPVPRSLSPVLKGSLQDYVVHPFEPDSGPADPRKILTYQLGGKDPSVPFACLPVRHHCPRSCLLWLLSMPVPILPSFAGLWLLPAALLSLESHQPQQIFLFPW